MKGARARLSEKPEKRKSKIFENNPNFFAETKKFT